MTRRKVAMIGLDGADWRLLKPWIGEGNLPTLAKLVSEGTHGNLCSTIRPESSVAWSSFSTGVNPGKHGVFGFVERTEGYTFKLANGSSVRARRFWDVLSEQGLDVGMLNIPFTYPPSPVNGFIVTGMLTPGPDVAFAYPKSLQQQLLKRFDDYLFDVGDSTRNKAVLIENVRRYTCQQRETALFLLQEQPWDLFTMVFTGPDRLQHFLWADMDPRHPLHDPESASQFDRALLEHYQILDDAIAKILNRLPGNTTVILISDHGFNGCAHRFYVNQWLREQGLLVLRETRTWRSNLVSLLSRLGSVHWLRRLKRAIFPDRWSSAELHAGVFIRAIDWSRTKTYFGMDGGLRINLQGREPQGIVRPDEYDALRQELRQMMLAVTDPRTKQSPLSNVFLQEELYHGPFVGKAPDVILEPQRENSDAAGNFVLDGSLDANRTSAFGSSLPYSGNHTLDGIFIAWGADVASGQQIPGAQIVDIAPTILATLGMAIPEYMDGRVLSEIFSPECALAPRRTAESELCAPQEPAKPFSLEEEELVESRLRNLGYLD
jgi:predicted AlkP superfamily phosphohydrolase/phosphomutase